MAGVGADSGVGAGQSASGGTARPDVLIKGADYSVSTVVGADVVQSYGGEVKLADIVEGRSTTATLLKLSDRRA